MKKTILGWKLRDIWLIDQDQEASMLKVLVLKRLRVNVCGSLEITKVKVLKSLLHRLGVDRDKPKVCY